MMTALEYRGLAGVPRNRRACAMPDLRPGRAYFNTRRARIAGRYLKARPTRPPALPRSGMAHATSGGGQNHA